MDVGSAFSEILGAIDKFVGSDVPDVERKVGEEAVQYARDFGSYHDVTGNLRRSNYYEITPDGLRIGNSADYASKVEAEGKEVCSGAALYAEKRLKELANDNEQ